MAKPLTPHLLNIRSIYDARAATYDHETGPDGFHPRQARDYVKWASPSPGCKLLDLACGTGEISLACARLASPGMVIGVDISPASLEVARQKAQQVGLGNVKFVEGDIADLLSEWAEKEGIRQGMFDVITCASAFVLLEDQPGAVKSWAKLLKKGGKVIFDAATGDSQIKALALERVTEKLGIVRTYTREGIDSEEKVRSLLTGAGLDDSEFFVSENYEDGGVVVVENAGATFDDLVKEKKWFRGWYDELDKPGRMVKARELFCKEIEKIANGEKEVRSWWRFYMAVGRKID
ncbi:S-adenosyl-L-methionine-dependent methyltransferase [Hyaloscypha variabilis F]|uniref:S-adenosyl-L-methionine-dependent methyltransferase n=1 Tax=Hyaloscypha variabilis (strain UAMH 11265 / GT02V1 / F) TaxID=1149755 RepID=A0A2J6S6H2_HYAVF|nr:S-adenosyl-L-methionine-dependent methyltransferase [Hyaloscypha variabilis F]